MPILCGVPEIREQRRAIFCGKESAVAVQTKGSLRAVVTMDEGVNLVHQFLDTSEGTAANRPLRDEGNYATRPLRWWRSRVSMRRSFRLFWGGHFVQAADQMDAILNSVAVTPTQPKANKQASC